MSRTLALLVLVALLGSCEKDRPAASSPGPTVIVEQPGETPAVGTEAGDPTTGEPTTGDGDQPEFGSFEVVTTDVPCTADADCVKDDCCHATSCVAIADAPDCSAAVCTLECRAKTMDCNGGCICQSGVCAARLWSAPTQ